MTKGMKRLVSGVGLGLALIVGDASAQRPGLREVRDRGAAGLGALLALPIGEFKNFVDAGGGVDFFAVWNPIPERALGLRVDGSFLIYGSQTQTVPLSPTVRRIDVDVSTTNAIASLYLGPQLTLGHGAVRPYAFGGLGVAYFFTESSVRGSSGLRDFASTTNFDDTALALQSGGGLQIALSRRRTTVLLDLSARFVRNGQVSYLREGGIVEAADGSLIITPIESQANLVVLQLGVTVGLR